MVYTTVFQVFGQVLRQFSYACLYHCKATKIRFPYLCDLVNVSSNMQHIDHKSVGIKCPEKLSIEYRISPWSLKTAYNMYSKPAHGATLKLSSWSVPRRPLMPSLANKTRQPNVVGAGPTLKQHWGDVLCFLGQKPAVLQLMASQQLWWMTGVKHDLVRSQNQSHWKTFDIRTNIKEPKFYWLKFRWFWFKKCLKDHVHRCSRFIYLQIECVHRNTDKQGTMTRCWINVGVRWPSIEPALY